MGLESFQTSSYTMSWISCGSFMKGKYRLGLRREGMVGVFVILVRLSLLRAPLPLLSLALRLAA
jgi:hypothetical protein